MIGKSLLHYRVTEKIGAGGMGVVYRATDTKLQRDVAIKVLPEAFSKDKERLARFEREARVLASLNHPNLAAIHGLEESEGMHFLVLELVPGETLAERIASGAIGVEQALPLFAQIAEAIEAAHSKGVVHRDLKPANIKVTPEGKIKVLDFGLAKPFEAAPTQDLSQSPTLTRKETATGVILGTASYMSPEQARGSVVDKRTDIWGFGCVLYEALAGTLAFRGDTLSDTLASVLKGEPDWEKLPETTPAGMRVLLRRCLQKDPERRLRDIGDARLEIEDALSGASEFVSAGTVTAKPEARWRRAFPWSLTALVAGAWLFWPSPEVPRPVLRTSIVLPPEGRRSIAISPDGTTIVYGTEAKHGGRTIGLYVRRLDQDESKPIPGTEGADTPFFSPDGEWVGFFKEDDELKKVRLDGVGAVVLSEGDARGGSWGADDTIVFAQAFNSALMKISANGGAPETLTTLDPDKQETSHRWPQLLPNGDAVLFTAFSGEPNDARIVAQSLSTGERRFLTQGAQARYVSTGHLVYAWRGTLYAVLFDADRLEASGNFVPVLVGVGEWGTGEHYFAISETGTLVYVPADPTERRLVLVDFEGHVEPLTVPAGPHRRARFSRDGRQIALISDDGKVHLYELENQRFSLLFSSITDQAGSVWTPAHVLEWSPDGTRLAVVARAPVSGLSTEIFIVPVDGRGAVQQVASSRWSEFPSGWSPDGKRLLYWNDAIDGSTVIWELPLEPKGEPRLLVGKAGFNAGHPILSPDGRWLAYTASFQSGRNEVYVTPYDGAGAGRQVSIDGGDSPVWASDGREVYYHNGAKIMAVTISTEPIFSAGRPRELFEGPYFHQPLARGYDLSPDGRKFVMIESPDAPPVTEIRVVQNWTEELKRLVPTR